VFVGWFVREYVCSLTCVGAAYLETVGDRGSDPMNYQREMAYSESNGHVLDDVT